VTLTAGPCPPPLSGTLTGADTGNRTPLKVRLVWPEGAQALSAMFDTVEPALANHILQQDGCQSNGPRGAARTPVGGGFPNKALTLAGPGILRHSAEFAKPRGHWNPRGFLTRGGGFLKEVLATPDGENDQRRAPGGDSSCRLRLGPGPRGS
jgi:hypothetical protein